MAQFTTLQLASNITGVSVYSKPSVFNGAENSILSYSQQLYLKISTSAGSSEIKNKIVGVKVIYPDDSLYYRNGTLTISLEGGESIYNVSITPNTAHSAEITSFDSSTGRIKYRIWGATRFQGYEATITYTIVSSSTSYDEISLYDLCQIGRAENLYMTISGGGLNNIFADDQEIWFLESGNQRISISINYHNTTTNEDETYILSYYQEITLDSSEEIVNIEIVESPSITISQTLEHALQILSLSITYGDDSTEDINALTFFGDSTWYDALQANKGIHLTCANGFYLSGVELTESDIGISDYENVLFKENGDNEVSITFYYLDEFTSNLREFVFTFTISVAEITSVSIEPNITFDNGYAPNRTYSISMGEQTYTSLTLTDNIITATLFKNDGTSASLSDLYSYSITAEDNNTHTTYASGDTLPSGEYTITLTYKIRADYSDQTTTCQLSVYDLTNASLIVVFNKLNYIVGQRITNSDFSSSVEYEIGNSSNTYTKLVNVGLYTPKTSSIIGKTPITFRYIGRDTAFISLQTSVDAIFSPKPNDHVYYFDKTKTIIGANEYFVRHLYGEIENNYNIGLTLDGTKDSCKIIVYNQTREELKPNTIIYLESTDTYWIVKTDKSKRYASEDNALWEHTIQLYGLFELFNARDLIVCGFNKDRYTIQQVLDRIIEMSDIEFSVGFDLYPYIDGNQKMTYLKTFDNYNPASAMKELFNGMNCVPKAKLTTTTIVNGEESYVCISDMRIYPISKSGINDTPINIDDFNREEEEIKSDLENYGTRVVSNVQNCVSAEAIRYPIIGGARLTSNSEKVVATRADSAVLRLPSNVNKVNKLFGYYKVDFSIKLHFYSGNPSGYNEDVYIELYGYYICDFDFETFRKNIFDKIFNSPSIPISAKWPIWNNVEPNLPSMYETIISSKIGVFVLENGGEYYPIDKTINDKCVIFSADSTPSHGTRPYLALNDKLHADTCSHHSFSTIYWEQGSNQIKNFTFLDSKYRYQEDISPVDEENWGVIEYEPDNKVQIIVNFYKHQEIPGYMTVENMRFAVEYVPMSDIKIKVDNDLNENDTSLFNQNGKLIDSSAISKLINSHSVAISSNEIDRYGTYYNFFNIPKVGQIVLDNGDEYIINNVSIDFSENDNNHYRMDCQFTMTKKIACKSTMISANTNIRDYDCPQNNNVVRKQTYRDYIEFSEVVGSQVIETPYLDIGSNFVFTTSQKGNVDNHICVFSVDMNTYGTFYYKLGCVKYNLKKQYIEVCDFLDNNIIGYEANKRHFLLTPQTLLTHKSSMVNTPISYVDDFGECNSLELRFLDKTQLYNAYYYNTSEDYSTSSIYNHVSVPQVIWEYINADNSRYDIAIDEPNYKKDGLEVPFFEYVCQVGDNENIVVGEDLLKGEEVTSGYSFVYGYAITDEAKITQENYELFTPSNLSASNATISYDSETHKITITLIENSTNLLGKNVVIYLIERKSGSVLKKELLFAINGCKVNGTNTIELYASNYKLK